MDQKWISEGGDFYPIPGNTVLHPTPGPGIFQLFKNNTPTDQRIGLRWIGNEFKFDFKVYDLGSDEIIEKIKRVWESDYYTNKNCNLGAIFNGIKGTGKTISAKLLCNRIGIPTIIIPYYTQGLQDFIQALEFECIVLIDEAEKTFRENNENDAGEVLLKLIDGVYNKSRKLYILTTNTLSINDNLKGRPGRIRYIEQFGNLSNKAINEFLDDNLLDKGKRVTILKMIDQLEISTIDILRAMVDEVNMGEDLTETTPMNMPKASFSYRAIVISDIDPEKLDKAKSILLEHHEDLSTWLDTEIEGRNGYTQSDKFCDEYDAEDRTLNTQFSILMKGSDTSCGNIISEPDKDGFFITSGYNYSYDKGVKHCLVVTKKNAPSLYRGQLY